MRYRINKATQVIHDKRATEKCNLDDANEENVEEVGRREMAELAAKAGYELCEHCFADDD